MENIPKLITTNDTAVKLLGAIDLMLKIQSVDINDILF